MQDCDGTVVRDHETLHAALTRLNEAATGFLCMVNDAGRLERTITDGDLRRMLLAGFGLEEPLKSLPQKTPLTLLFGTQQTEAETVMREHGVDQLPLVDVEGRPVKIVSLRQINQRIYLSRPHMGSMERELVQEAFDTNWIAPVGPNIVRFEADLATCVGSDAAAALSSGTAAIHLALVITEVGPGDSVFCSSLTFAASANPILYQGAEPVFIDSEPETWNMSPAALARAFEAAEAEGRLPKAVIAVGLYGQSPDMDPIKALCTRYGAVLIEDAAESLGATYKGRASGSIGDFGIYSFNGNKIITTSGGGMLVSNNAEAIDRARYLATQAREPARHYEHVVAGYNYRISNILAGIGVGQLGLLDQRVARRREIFETYRTSLTDVAGLNWMPEAEFGLCTRWLTALTIDPATGVTPDALIDVFEADNIEVRPVWKPMHMQPVFAEYGFHAHPGSENSPISAQLFETGVCLPSGSDMKSEDVERVCCILRRAMAQ